MEVAPPEVAAGRPLLLSDDLETMLMHLAPVAMARAQLVLRDQHQGSALYLLDDEGLVLALEELEGEFMNGMGDASPRNWRIYMRALRLFLREPLERASRAPLLSLAAASEEV